MLFVKYASILLQAITLKIDEVFIHAFMDLAASLVPQVSSELVTSRSVASGAMKATRMFWAQYSNLGPVGSRIHITV